MRVGIYARVSTDDKDQDPERQIQPCKNYCELHNHKIVGEYKDHISGDTQPITRHGFSEMMKHKPQGIVVYSIDRLTRQHPNKIMMMLNQYRDTGIIIISVSEPIFNMESPMAEPMQYFLTWWNNYFLKKLKDDIKTGLDRARANGKVLGRPKAKFNKYRAYHLLFDEKKSLSEVKAELGVSRSTLHRFKKVAEKTPDLFIKKGSGP